MSAVFYVPYSVYKREDIDRLTIALGEEAGYASEHDRFAKGAGAHEVLIQITQTISVLADRTFGDFSLSGFSRDFVLSNIAISILNKVITWLKETWKPTFTALPLQIDLRPGIDTTLFITLKAAPNEYFNQKLVEYIQSHGKQRREGPYYGHLDVYLKWSGERQDIEIERIVQIEGLERFRNQ